jgi:hypothetical protein
MDFHIYEEQLFAKDRIQRIKIFMGKEEAEEKEEIAE